MKTVLLPALLAIALICGCTPKNENQPASSLAHHTGKIKISGAYALFPLAEQWVKEYRKVHPEVEFDLVASGTGMGFEDVLSGNSDLGMISQDIPYEADKILWNTPVARLAVVPVINSKNPCLADIQKRGFTHDELTALFSGNGARTWGELCGCSNKSPVHVYIRGDRAGATRIWLNYLFLDSTELTGTRVNGEDKMMDQVMKDPLAISYCNFIYACDPRSKKILDELVVLPLDVNRNGRIEGKENFYNDYTELQRAMWSEKYPHVLLRDLYLVHKDWPNTIEIVDFLKWILTDGQKMIPDEGYIELHTSEIRCRMNFLTHIDTMAPPK